MSLTSVNSAANDQLIELLRQRREAMRAMIEAVRNADAAAAKDSAAALQADNEKAAGATGGASTAPGDNPYRITIRNDLSSLMSAVQSGDLAQAQAALGKLEADSAPAQENVAPSDQASQLVSFLKDLKDVVSSVASGDGAGAQSAAATLQADLEKLLGTTGADSPASQDTQNPFLSDIESLITSAQSGDLGAAQDAIQKLANDLTPEATNAAGEHHHHHFHSQGGTDAATANSGEVMAAYQMTITLSESESSPTVSSL